VIRSWRHRRLPFLLPGKYNTSFPEQGAPVFRPVNIVLLNLAMVLSLGAFFPVVASEAPSAPARNESMSISTAGRNLADGLYLVARSAHEPEKVEPLAESERLIANDFHLLEPAERKPAVYLVLQTEPFVPLVLATAPREDREEASGKPRLHLELAEDQSGLLEDFTRAHLGETVAIVIGGDVVTTHKVKSVITGGRLQITRCTKHGCQTLYTELLKKPG